MRSWEPPSQKSNIAASLTSDAQIQAHGEGKPLPTAIISDFLRLSLTVGPVVAQEQQEHKEATDIHGMSS